MKIENFDEVVALVNHRQALIDSREKLLNMAKEHAGGGYKVTLSPRLYFSFTIDHIAGDGAVKLVDTLVEILSDQLAEVENSLVLNNVEIG